MTASSIRKLTIGNKSFSLNALIANPDGYLPLMQPFFTEKMFARKDSETGDNDKYFTRLFTWLYAKQNHIVNTGSNATRAPRTSIPLDESCNSILSALGIDIVKKCPKRSSVMFKSSGNSYKMNNEEIVKLAEAVKHDMKFKVNHKLLNKSVSFGVELEFIGKRDQLYEFTKAMDKAVGANRFVNCNCYHKNVGKTWELGCDCSVKPTGDLRGCGMYGYELTSPILNLSKKKDLQELATVCNIVKTIFNGVTNKTCGTHVHMSFPVEKASDNLLEHFVRSYRKSESSLFDKLVPLERRENRARYAKTASLRYMWDRYRKINVTKVKKDSDNMHLEFRQLDGTLEYDKIISWVKLQKLFCEMTMDSFYKETVDENKPIQIELSDVIVTKKLGAESIEPLMKMSKLVA